MLVRYSAAGARLSEFELPEHIHPGDLAITSAGRVVITGIVEDTAPGEEQASFAAWIAAFDP